ncbi:MAG TPA: hypothetical protein VN442_03640 [Bryobacteraceae bacterium]|nr:hypothetical protein [Bryobacteraceae bacterium]
MATSRMQYSIASALLVIGAFLTGCSTASKPPQPGTPAFYWAAAREMYRAGDYVKTNDNLAQLTRSENDFTARARVWQVVISAGVAQAHMELADTYETGARANRNNPAPFRRETNVQRNAASTAALQFAEAFHNLQHSVKDETIALEFDFPRGNAAMPPELKKVTSGIVLPPAELALVAKAMVQRGVLLSTCRAVGAPEDPAKALELFKAGNPQVRTDAFRIHMASQLYDAAQLFAPTKLDQPQRTKMLLKEAMETTQSVPADKRTKELTGKIQGLLKKQKLTL